MWEVDRNNTFVFQQRTIWQDPSQQFLIYCLCWLRCLPLGKVKDSKNGEGRRLTFDVTMENVVAVHVMKTREQLLSIATNMTWWEDLMMAMNGQEMMKRGRRRGRGCDGTICLDERSDERSKSMYSNTINTAPSSNWRLGELCSSLESIHTDIRVGWGWL